MSDGDLLSFTPPFQIFDWLVADKSATRVGAKGAEAPLLTKSKLQKR